jgi:hypothetical protein
MTTTTTAMTDTPSTTTQIAPVTVTTGAAPNRTRPTVTTATRTSPTAPPTTTKATVRVTTTTLPPAWQPSPESLVAVPNPRPAPLPSTTTTVVVMNPDKTAPGVQMTPPYEAPTVTSVGPVTCTRRPEAPNHYNLSFTATLVGGRYWTYPSGGGNGHTSSLSNQSVGNLSGRPEPFEFLLDSLTVRTPDSANPVSVPIRFPVTVRCPSGG